MSSLRDRQSRVRGEGTKGLLYGIRLASSFARSHHSFSYCACFQERHQYQVCCSLYGANTLKGTLPCAYDSLVRIMTHGHPRLKGRLGKQASHLGLQVGDRREWASKPPIQEQHLFSCYLHPCLSVRGSQDCFSAKSGRLHGRTLKCESRTGQRRGRTGTISMSAVLQGNRLMQSSKYMIIVQTEISLAAAEAR